MIDFKRKIKIFLSLILIITFVTACGKKEEPIEEPLFIMESEHIKIDGLYVDESFEDEEFDLVYLFYTLDAKEKDINVSSKSISLKVDDNEYSATLDRDYIPLYTNYYYSEFLNKVETGKKLKICSTFKIAKEEFDEEKNIVLTTVSLKDIKKDISIIRFRTVDIKRLENLDKIYEDIDNETYIAMKDDMEDALSDASSDTESKVKKLINGYYFTFYPTIGETTSTYKIEFASPDKFTLTENVSGKSKTTSGTYAVKNKAIVFTYSTKESFNLRYEFVNDDIELVGLTNHYSTYVDYNPNN